MFLFRTSTPKAPSKSNDDSSANASRPSSSSKALKDPKVSGVNGALPPTATPAAGNDASGAPGTEPAGITPPNAIGKENVVEPAIDLPGGNAFIKKILLLQQQQQQQQEQEQGHSKLTTKRCHSDSELIKTPSPPPPSQRQKRQPAVAGTSATTMGATNLETNTSDHTISTTDTYTDTTKANDNSDPILNSRDIQRSHLRTETDPLNKRKHKKPINRQASKPSPLINVDIQHYADEDTSDLDPYSLKYMKKSAKVISQYIMSSLKGYFWSSSLLSPPSNPTTNNISAENNTHMYIPRTMRQIVELEAREVKKIVIIGVHGWFPTKILQLVAGEPTGKSQRFCEKMKNGLLEYFMDEYGIDLDNVNGVDGEKAISCISLVGEGQIQDRVEMLFKQLVEDQDYKESPPVAAAAENSNANDAKQPNGAPTGGGKSDKINEANLNGKGKNDNDSDSNESKPPPQQSSVSEKDITPIANTSSATAKENEATETESTKKTNIEKLQEADMVFIVTHSQGTPVSAQILDRLIDLQILNPRKQRVCFLAMAGINHGPLPAFQNSVVLKYIEAQAAHELFEFMDPLSEVSVTYVASLGSIMQRGVRMICVGSWIDEVVPLHSAVFQSVTHHNLYRAVYIDGPHYKNDFLTRLINFCLKLRNAGIDDRGLLVHLSQVIVGALWGSTSGGHSTIYEETKVYKLAINWAFCSTLMSEPTVIRSSPLRKMLVDNPNDIGTNITGGGSSSGGGSKAKEIIKSIISKARITLFRLPPLSKDKNAITSLHIQYTPLKADEKLNPFYLPWIVRTLWDDPQLHENPKWKEDIEELVQLYDDWEPSTKAGKDLKYRLEPIRVSF
ncbi:hypothetical protein H4219_005379 [Mycoemilia scoparia]|uniref:YMC020W-like alpha/beta hydrolase domain-containing protein n=1 Tax=Mycoemilia scoparia TaxID=417184 RepID=A0A9W7ZWD4_9FUNG|nr:hypothetical protein H4219_005379 [Mycoemilia scoparia]